MAATFGIYVNKDEDINETIVARIGHNANHKIVYMTIPTKYSGQTVFVEAFEGQVISSRHCNLAAFDDYRPGSSFLVPVTNAEGEITYKSFTVSHEMYDRFAESVSVDASDDIKAAYNAYKEYEYRKHNVMKKWEERNDRIQDAKDAGLPNYHYAKRLLNVSPSTTNYYEGIKLLKTFKNGKMRSSFRISLATQIMNWVMDSNPLYKSPLSPKQWNTLVPYKTY